MDAGVFCSLAASLLATMSQAGQVFEGYENASQTIFSQSVLMQIVAAGVVMPIVEEYIFRGLMYNRMKDYMSANMAMIISSVIFGLYHGNLIQGVYGFVMGLLMIFVYEKYQTMLAPVLCHIGANMISIVLQFLNIQLDSVMVAVMAAAVCLVAAYLLLRLIQKQIHVGTVLNKRYIDAGLDSNTIRMILQTMILPGIVLLLKELTESRGPDTVWMIIIPKQRMIIRSDIYPGLNHIREGSPV